MVSDKMVEAGFKSVPSLDKFTGEFEIALQAGINAAWPKFDAEDPETWPQTEGLYLCMFDIGKIEIRGFKTELAHTWHLVQRYCDIADILPEES